MITIQQVEEKLLEIFKIRIIYKESNLYRFPVIKFITSAVSQSEFKRELEFILIKKASHSLEEL